MKTPLSYKFGLLCWLTCADDTQKPDQAEMGIFKHGFCHQAALDELHRCQKFF